MRFRSLALGPVLGGCALMAVTSCNTDDKNPDAGVMSALSPAAAVVSAYDIVKVSSMTIDGDLSEWSNIQAIPIADNSGRTGGVDNTANVKLAWDDTYLYASYDVTDTELLAVQTVRDSANIFKDDEVELYIDPQGDGANATSMTTTDYQFLANIREALGDSRGNPTGGKDSTYNANSFLAKVHTNGTLNASGTDVGYSVELRISWQDLGVTPAAGKAMRLDPVVGDRDTPVPPPVQSFDWAGLTAYNNPSGWKDVQLVNPPPPQSDYDVVKVAPMTIDGNLGEWASIPAISIADNSGRTGGVDNTAKVKLAWDDNYLYASYDVTDTELLAVQTVRDSANIFKDDEIELYVDPQADGTSAPSMTSTDYQFLANIREAVGDLRGNGSGGKDSTYNANSFLAKVHTNGTLNASGTDVGYTVELRISWTDLGVTPAVGKLVRLDPAVGDRDTPVPPPVQSFDWAGLTNYNTPSAWKTVKLADAVMPPARGRPWGVIAGNQWPNNTTLAANTEPFNLSEKDVTANQIIARMNAARDTNVKLVLMMTGGSHGNYMSKIGADSLFDRRKWTARQQSFNTQAIRDSVAARVADGTVVGADVMDEPYVHGSNTWGPESTMVKIDTSRFDTYRVYVATGGAAVGATSIPIDPLWKALPDSTVLTFLPGLGRTAILTQAASQGATHLTVKPLPTALVKGDASTSNSIDNMAAEVKNIFPELAVGVTHQHMLFWPDVKYAVTDFIIDQYNNSRGSVTQFRDDGLAQGVHDGIKVVFSLNLLDGGDANATMTPAQVQTYASVLGPAGPGLLMWKYDETTMAQSSYKTAFQAVAAAQDTLTTTSWHR